MSTWIHCLNSKNHWIYTVVLDFDKIPTEILNVTNQFNEFKCLTNFKFRENILSINLAESILDGVRPLTRADSWCRVTRKTTRKWWGWKIGSDECKRINSLKTIVFRSSSRSDLLEYTLYKYYDTSTINVISSNCLIIAIKKVPSRQIKLEVR